MTCPSCGRENAAGGVFCMRCGAPLQQTVGESVRERPAASPPPVYGAQPAESPGFSPASIHPQYAGFWRRFFASLIDGIILGILTTVVYFPVAMVIGLAGFAGASSSGDFSNLGVIEGPLVALNWIVSISISWLYEALLTASAKQATLGKMALGMIVTDLEGRRMSFGRATGRYFGKWVSSFTLLIGYLIQPFTAKRQALHDMLAGTLVLMQR
jgi:uncharacterized RDD family membrane protein YckC